MSPLTTQGGHSAQVNMLLIINGLTLPVAQMGPDFVILDTPINHPPADASLVLQVDQSESRWNVHLPKGISVGEERVEIGPSV